MFTPIIWHSNGSITLATENTRREAKAAANVEADRLKLTGKPGVKIEVSSK